MSTAITPAITSSAVLIVDDEPYIREMLARWLTASGYRPLQAANSAEAWRCLEANEVHLVTLDIAMPGESGLDLLAKLKAGFPEMPVLMLTATGTTKTAIAAMTAGAFGYLVKPVQQEELLVQVSRGLEWRQLWLERRAYTQSLEKKVIEQTRVIRQAHEETIHRLVAATMCRDEETGAHIVRSGLCTEVLARAAGWSDTEAQRIRLAAPMHDIGKIGIPDAILQKPGRLTAEEYDVMKTHTTIGADVLTGSQSPVLQLAREIALNHHERWDGKGYPAGLAGDAIPVAARMVSIVDVYDALTHDRVYRRAFSEEQALTMMREQQGAQFDPLLLTVFFTVLEEVHELSMQNPDEVCEQSIGRALAVPPASVTLSLPALVNV